MKKIIPFLAFVCLTSFTATSGLPVIASSCRSHQNKTAEIKCAEDDIDCQNTKVEKYGLNKNVNS